MKVDDNLEPVKECDSNNLTFSFSFRHVVLLENIFVGIFSQCINDNISEV